MQTLLVARHGHAESNAVGIASCAVPGAGLTDEGVAQAKALGVELAGVEFALGVASELARTRETLALALAGREVPTATVAELNEIDFGTFDGGSLAVYRSWAASNAPATRPPGEGESRADAAARFARGLRLLLVRPEDNVLLVGHALPIRYLVDAAAGLEPAAVMSRVDHTAVHRLDADGVERAAHVLESWSRAPRFRDHSLEGSAS